MFDLVWWRGVTMSREAFEFLRQMKPHVRSSILDEFKFGWLELRKPD